MQRAIVYESVILGAPIVSVKYDLKAILSNFDTIDDIKNFLNNNNTFDSINSVVFCHFFTENEIFAGFKSSDSLREFFKKNKCFKHYTPDKINQTCWTLDLFNKLKTTVDVSKFINFLRKHNACITGSTILQIVKGVNYDDSDIDIYVKEITKEMITDLEQITNRKCLSVMETKYDQEHYSQENNTNIKIVKNLSEITVNGQKIQLIEPESSIKNIDEYINTFDLDICKNYFDGSKFVVTNLSNIMNNKAIYDESYFKYRSNDPDENKRVDKIYMKLIERVCKYNKRGFNILFSSDFIQRLSNEKNNLIIIKSATDNKFHTIPVGENESIVATATASNNKFNFLMKCMKEKYAFI